MPCGLLCKAFWLHPGLTHISPCSIILYPSWTVSSLKVTLSSVLLACFPGCLSSPGFLVITPAFVTAQLCSPMWGYHCHCLPKTERPPFLVRISIPCTVTMWVLQVEWWTSIPAPNYVYLESMTLFEKKKSLYR